MKISKSAGMFAKQDIGKLHAIIHKNNLINPRKQLDPPKAEGVHKAQVCKSQPSGPACEIPEHKKRIF